MKKPELIEKFRGAMESCILNEGFNNDQSTLPQEMLEAEVISQNHADEQAALSELVKYIDDLESAIRCTIPVGGFCQFCQAVRSPISGELNHRSTCLWVWLGGNEI